MPVGFDTTERKVDGYGCCATVILLCDGVFPKQLTAAISYEETRMPVTLYYVTLPKQTHPCRLPDRYAARFTEIMRQTLGYLHVRLRSRYRQRERTFFPLGVVANQADGQRLVAAVVADREFLDWPFSVQSYNYQEHDEVTAVHPA